MKLLRCLLCRGECDIVNHERAINKHIKCRSCHYSNENEQVKKSPEVVFIKRKTFQQ